jgi:hypothetical protein
VKQLFALFIAAAGWFAVTVQYFLMLHNRVESIGETTLRFFSFFTILTNIIVAIYFTCLLLPERKRAAFITKAGSLTAVTCYITIVGLIYQLVLRGLWQPVGWQKLVDELLHSVIPAVTVIFWMKYEDSSGLRYGQMWRWLWYPLLYLICILLRGEYAEFYPYPFLHVGKLGFGKVLMNSLLISALFVLIGALYIFIITRIRLKLSHAD